MDTPPRLQDIYSDMPPEELATAEDNVRRYVAVMVRIYERVLAEQGAEAASRLARGDGYLTSSAQPITIQTERSNGSEES